MPSQRFLLVEGVDGFPVSDPHSPATHGSPARYVGWELDGCEHGEGGTCAVHEDCDHVLEHYRKAQQIVADHRDLRTAIAVKQLRLLGETIAKSHEAARAALAKSPASAKTSTTPAAS